MQCFEINVHVSMLKCSKMMMLSRYCIMSITILVWHVTISTCVNLHYCNATNDCHEDPKMSVQNVVPVHRVDGDIFHRISENCELLE